MNKAELAEEVSGKTSLNKKIRPINTKPCGDQTH